jgi:hypothetical protein
MRKQIPCGIRWCIALAHTSIDRDGETVVHQFCVVHQDPTQRSYEPVGLSPIMKADSAQTNRYDRT